MQSGPRRVTPGASGRRRGLLIFSVTILAVFLIALNFATGGALGNAARVISTPVRDAGEGLANAIGGSGFFSSKRALEAQVAALQSELQQASARSAAFEVVEEQNMALSKIANLATSSAGVAAPVTSSIISSPYGTFEIGAGSSDGIASGALVEDGEGIVVGVIADVGAHQSLVKEIFASGQTTDVIIDGSSAPLSGEGGDDGLVLLPNGLPIKEGDAVVAPVLRDKPIGIVGHVTANPADAQMQVYVTLPESLSSLQLVYVVPS